MRVDILTIIEQCEDQLFPRLQFTVRERSLYYHLLGHTRLIGRDQHTFALLPLARALGVSEWSTRADIRALHSRHCLEIVERSQSGHLVRVFLPAEIEGALASAAPAERVDIESLDFFSGRRFISALLEREGDSCFYCMRSVRLDTCALDHVVPQASHLNNSYRNVVVACHDCNSKKSGGDARDFVRSLYRTGILSESDLSQRLHALDQLQAGELVPDIAPIVELDTSNQSLQPTAGRSDN
jgi:hypothetical protein